SIIQGFQVISNAGRATIDGAEASLAYTPLPGLRLSGGLNYNDARLDTPNPAIGAEKGDPLPLSPKLTGTLAADYSLPLSARLYGRAGLTYAYQGDRWSSWVHDPLNTGYHIPSWNTVDARAGVDLDNWSFTLNVANLTDTHAISSARRLRVTPTQ